MHLLFVCSGNTCRSPLAVAAWESVLREKKRLVWDAEVERLEQIEVNSAGLWALPNRPAARHAITAAQQWGIDLAPHRSRRVEADLVSPSTQFVAMTSEHVQAIRAQVKVPAARVQLLPNYAPLETCLELAGISGLWNDISAEGDRAHGEILDPFGGSLEGYQACAAQIRRCVQGLLAAVCDGSLR